MKKAETMTKVNEYTYIKQMCFQVTFKLIEWIDGIDITDK